VCTLNATKVTDAVGSWLGLTHDEMAEAALAAPSGSNGVSLIPYFDGERTPDLPDATGTWLGLRTSTTRQDLARSAHEGVVRSLLNGLDAVHTAGAAVDGQLHLIGGGAKSPAYRRIVADLHDAPVMIPSVSETVAAGACVQAAWMAGHQIGEIAGEWGLGEGQVIHPD